MLQGRSSEFSFSIGDVILAKYEREVYYAKITSIDQDNKKAMLLFDDDSKEELSFDSIFSVNETTSDIICVVCKTDQSAPNDDIVLCDKCNVGFHQKCHTPYISSQVLTPDAPWECTYCEEKQKNPFIERNPFESIKEEDTTNVEQEKSTEQTSNDSKMEQLVDVTGVVDESMRKSSSETEIEKPLQNNRRDLDLIVQDIKNKQNQNVQYSKTKPELDTKADSVFPRNYSAFGNQNIKSETNSLERKSLLLQRLTEGTDELSNNEEKSKMDTSVDDNEQTNDKNQEKFKALGKRNYQYVYCDHKDIVNNNNPQLECVSSHCEHSDIQYESLSKNLKTSHPQTLSLLSTSSSTNLVHLKEENLYKSKVFHNDKSINGSAENDLLIGDTNGVNRMEFESYSNNDKDISANDDIKITNVESLSRGRPSNEDPSNTNINLKVTDTSGEMDSMDKKQTFFSYSEIKNCLSPQRSPLKSLVSSKAQVENQESRLNLMRKKDFSNPVALPELKVEADDSVTKSISNEIPEPSLPSIDAYHSPIYSRKKVQEETSKAFSLSKSRTSTTLYELSSGSKETPSKSAFSAIKPRSENMTRNKISPNSYTSPCPPSLINENLRSPPLLYPPERLPEKQNKSHSTPHENSQNVVYDSLISKTLSSKERPVTLEMERNKDPFNLNRPNYERGAYMEKYREEISNYKNIEEGSDRRENFRREHIPVDIVKPQSPDGVTRNIAIQRQLENQKRWIDEHDSREQIQASLRKNKYEQQINTHTGNSSSDVNGYQRSVSVKPNGHQFSPMQIVDPRQKQLEIQKQQEELEKKLSLYAQEIEELKRQKEMLVSAQSSLANDEILRQQVTMETQLRKLQEFRQAQALQMLRNNSQSALGVQLLANNISNISATSISPQLCNTVQLLNNNANQQFGNNIIQQNQIAAASVLAKANNNFINSPLNNGLSAQLNSNLNLNQAQMQLALNKSPQLIKGGQGVNLAAGNVQAFSQTVLAQQLNNQKYPNVAQVPVNIDNSRLISKDRKERLTNVELNAIRAAEIQQAMSRKSGREILPNSSYSEFNKVTSGDLYRNQSFSPGNNYLQGRAQSDRLPNSMKPLGSDNDYAHSNNKYNIRNSPPRRSGPFSPSSSPSAYRTFQVKTKSPYSKETGPHIDRSNHLERNDNESEDNRLCKRCNAEAQFLCSGCRGSWYCSQKCQLADWKMHSQICKKSQGSGRIKTREGELSLS